MKKLLFFNLLLLFFAVFSASAQVTNISATFACPAGVVVSFDLNSANPVDVTLYYSHDSGQTWLVAQTISGDITNQTTGTGKTIVWDNQADNVTLGRFRLRVEIPEPEPELDCVMIADVCWATRNVDMPGTFVDNPQDFGMFYQFNRRIGWLNRTTSSEEGRWWDASNPPSIYNSANDPCPTGFRIPTLGELASLLSTNNIWIDNYRQTNVSGMLYGVAPNQIFLPAAGSLSNNGNLSGVNTMGVYMTQNAGNVLIFYDTGWHGIYPFTLPGGRSVRCVRE